MYKIFFWAFFDQFCELQRYEFISVIGKKKKLFAKLEKWKHQKNQTFNFLNSKRNIVCLVQVIGFWPYLVDLRISADPLRDVAKIQFESGWVRVSLVRASRRS